LGVIRHFPPTEISLVLGSRYAALKKNGSYLGASPLIPGYPDSFILIRTSDRNRPIPAYTKSQESANSNLLTNILCR